MFALGLIYAGRKEGGQEELRKALGEGNDPVIQHGAALGLGVSAIATEDEGKESVFDESPADSPQRFTMRSEQPFSRITRQPVKQPGTLWVSSCLERLQRKHWRR